MIRPLKAGDFGPAVDGLSLASMVASLLNINPSQLEFLFEADRELKSALNIRNVHDDVRAAFKIKVRIPAGHRKTVAGSLQLLPLPWR